MDKGQLLSGSHYSTCSHLMGMVSSCKQTPNMDPPKRLSIAHWKALGESYLLSHKSSSGGGSMKELWPLEENKVNIALS